MAHHTLAAVVSTESVVPTHAGTHSSYDPPAVVYEAALEVRAGSPEGIPGPTDLLDSLS
jgi:hypothetical protein